MDQKHFYKSMAWANCREAYINYRKAIDGGICEVCHNDLGLIVHHKIWLNDINCNDPDISLNFNNFRYECQVCHNKERNPDRVQGRCTYGPDGEIIPK